jgi:hypothetical protein
MWDGGCQRGVQSSEFPSWEKEGRGGDVGVEKERETYS